MTVLLPQRSQSYFIDHFYLQCIVCIALSEVWGSIFLNLTFLPLEMWYELFYHNFETFRTLVNEETLITYFIHMITSCKQNSYGSTFFSFHFKTQHSLLLSILLQVTLAYHSYLLVHMQLSFVLKLIEYLMTMTQSECTVNTRIA